MLEAAYPALAGRIRIVEGDITRPDLGLGAAAELKRGVSEVYHLAAIYDLSVPLDLAMRVNVEGTRHVLDFAAGCPGLERFHYVSTCYVSGRYPGIFGEDDLIKGQEFSNFYEETKYLAELEVQARMWEGMPATIYRPAIVVGDSTTGATQKYDGPYFVIRWLLRQPRFAAVLPVVANPRRTRVNVVPRDFVVDAIAYLSGRPETVRGVYQLADPEPLTVEEMLDVIARATHRRVLRIPLPLEVAKGAIERVPGVYALMRIPAPAVDYFAHPTYYATRRAREALRGSGIRVPPFPSYVDRLVSFVREHPEVEARGMA